MYNISDASMDVVAGWRVYRGLYDKSPAGVRDQWFMIVKERTVENELTGALRSAVRFVVVAFVLVLAVLKHIAFRADTKHKCRFCGRFRVDKEEQGNRKSHSGRDKDEAQSFYASYKEDPPVEGHRHFRGSPARVASSLVGG